MFRGGNGEHAVNEPIVQPSEHPVAKGWRYRRAVHDIERQLDPAVGGVDALAAGAARTGEPPPQFVHRHGDARGDDEIGDGCRHADDYP